MMPRQMILALCGVLASIPFQVLAAPVDPTESPRDAIATTRPQPVDFNRDVIPALTKAGCNAGACHGSFQGRGGFQLSLLGFDAAFDYDVLTKASRGRRLNVGIPERSLLLLKPTGAMPHGGGRRIAMDSEVAVILKDWISAGMPGPRPNDLNGLKLTVEPPDLVVPPAQEAAAGVPAVGGTGLKVTATFGDGTTRDVTRWASYDVREKLIADVTRQGLVTAHRPGKTAVQVRYLGQVAAVGVAVPYAASVEFDFPARNFIDPLAAAEWKRDRKSVV